MYKDECKFVSLLSFSDESILLDLKHLLIEAKQKVPPFLANMQSDSEKYLDIGGKAIHMYAVSVEILT